MRKDIAMKWVKALRSGKYKQTQSLLKRPKGGYCCLGVLQGPVLGLNISRGETTLSEEAINLSGMKNNDGDCGFDSIEMGRRTYDDLAAANDDGRRFKQIADWIEKNWERL